jgi:anionic cell wall polymer biosynthesis LytR-Cps2A-Psr (LCP) family protein
LAYARSRHLEYYSFPNSGWLEQGATGDLARIQRQQDFMRRLMNLAVQKSLTNPFTANKVVGRIIPNLKIDDALTQDDLLALIDVFSGVDANDSSKVAFLTLPATNGSAGSLSVLYVAETEAANLLEVMRDFSGKASHSSSPTATSSGSGGSTGTTGATGATSTTSTTQLAPAQIIDDDELGPPAEKTLPCT